MRTTSWLLAALVTASPVAAQPRPVIDLNQVGFEPADVKLAILRGAGTAPLPWQLLDADGNAVGRGETFVYGPDASSGAVVQRIDFSGFRRAGSGYRLSVAGVMSDPFVIALPCSARWRVTPSISLRNSAPASRSMPASPAPPGRGRRVMRRRWQAVSPAPTNVGCNGPAVPIAST